MHGDIFNCDIILINFMKITVFIIFKAVFKIVGKINNLRYKI